MLFTDGMPNRSPPEGEVAALRKLASKCPIHTFGFGYNLNSGLLYEMAQVSSGMNCFIPDATMVGTIFVNAISNILTTAAVNVSFSCKMDGEPNIGDLEYTKEGDSVTIKLGTVRYGQSFDILLDTAKISDPVLAYQANGIDETSSEEGELQNPKFDYHNLRLKAIKVLKWSLDSKDFGLWNEFLAES